MKSIISLLFLLPIIITPNPQQDGLYLEANSADPSTYEFDGNALVVQTDSILHFGFQYTSYYEIEKTNDSVFKLIFKRQYIQDNNHPKVISKRQKVKNGRTFWFQIDKHTFWAFRNIDDDEVQLVGYALEDSIFKQKLMIPLVKSQTN